MSSSPTAALLHKVTTAFSVSRWNRHSLGTFSEVSESQGIQKGDFFFKKGIFFSSDLQNCIFIINEVCHKVRQCCCRSLRAEAQAELEYGQTITVLIESPWLEAHQCDSRWPSVTLEQVARSSEICSGFSYGVNAVNLSLQTLAAFV